MHWILSLICPSNFNKSGNKNLIKKVEFTLVILFLFTIPIIGIVGSNYCSNPQTKSRSTSSDSSTDWNMFRGDLHHTGYSDSPAPDTNNLLWTFSTGDEVYSSPTVANSKVFVGSRDGKIYCLNQYSGQKIWEYSTGSGYLYGVTSAAAIVEGKVIFGSCNNNIYCLPEKDPNSDGIISKDEVIWIFPTEDAVYSSPAVVNDKVFIGSNDKNLYCLNVNTGKLIWKFFADEAVYSSPAVVNGKVYFGTAPCEGSSRAKIYCLDENTKKVEWSYYTGESIVSSPTVINDRVYFGCVDGNVYCFDANPGDSKDEGIKDEKDTNYDLIWKFYADVIYSSPAYANDKIYIGSLDDKVYCLDAISGKLEWDYETENDIYSSPVIADGKLYIGSVDGKIYCLNVSNGAHIWNYSTDYAEYGISSSPAVADGMVFIGSCDKNVYCFGKPTSQKLTVKMDVEVPSVYPGNKTKIQVTVYNKTTPVPNAYVTLAVEKGKLSKLNGYTDDNGNFESIYTAPIVYSTWDFLITANASKIGYTLGLNDNKITVKPYYKCLTVSIFASSSTVSSENKLAITVHVIDSILPVEGVEINLSVEEGSFLNIKGLTDKNGNFTTIYTAPKIDSGQIYVIEAKANKNKYIDGQGSYEIVVIEYDEEIDIRMYTIITIICCTMIIVFTTLVFQYRIKRKAKEGL